VAGWMGALRSGDQGQAETAKTSLKQAMEALSQAVGHKIGNIEELGRLAANPPAGMASDRIEATRRAYWDMVDGLAVGTMGLMATDLKLRSAVETGNAEGVRSLLGSEVLVGGEKVVIDSAVTNGRVLEILSKGDKLLKVGGKRGEVVERALTQLMDLYEKVKEGSRDEKEIEMVISYMNAERERAEAAQGPRGQASGEGVAEALGKVMGRSPEMLEQQKQDFYQAMLLHKNQLQIDPFSNYAPEWMKSEPKVLLQTLIALSNSCYFKWRYGDANLDVMADLRGEATFSAPNEMMQKMYEMKGVRESMEYFVSNFFTLELDSNNGLEFLKLKQDDGHLDALKNISVTQQKLMRGLIESGKVGNETEALAAVSTAFNLLYASHTFECGDVGRKLTPCEVYVEQMRAFMHPADKARAKHVKRSVGTEEGWGGTLGQWLVGTIERARVKVARGVVNDPDVEFAEQYRKRQVHPFPERLFASFLVLSDVTAYDMNGKVVRLTRKVIDRGTGKEKDVERDISLAEALMNGWKVDFEEDGKGGNMWGAYADISDSALKLYKACRGDEKAFPLPLGDNRARSQIIDWAANVGDARNKLRGTSPFLSPYVNTAEFVKWTIAACTKGGLFPSAELVLATPDVDGSQDLSFDMLFDSRSLVSSAEALQIKKEFHAVGWKSKFERSKIRGLRII
jgi:hypothetical protein